MKLEIKRPIHVYIYHCIWIVTTSLYATRNSSDFGRLTLIVMASIGTVSFISLLMKRNYFEIKENKLIINKDFFRTQSVELDKIERVTLEPGPFTSSKIILKDKTLIKYSDSHANDKELKELLGQYNIPVL